MQCFQNGELVSHIPHHNSRQHWGGEKNHLGSTQVVLEGNKSKKLNQTSWYALTPVIETELKFIVSQSVMGCSYNRSHM